LRTPSADRPHLRTQRPAAANIIDDGKKLWLSTGYAGFQLALFDLGGLASNSEMPQSMRENCLPLFRPPGDRPPRYRFAAMTAASLLRETMWSMVSEIHSQVDFDFAKYHGEPRPLRAAYAAFAAMRHA